jgi:hypothetical protein
MYTGSPNSPHLIYASYVNKYVRMIGLPFYILKNPLRKSEFFSDRFNIAIAKDRISAKTGFKIACDQLEF